MQANEGLSSGVLRTIRSDDTSPTELEDLLPGSGVGNELPGSYPNLDRLHADIQDVENVAADIERNTKAALADSVREVAVGVEGITANVIGGINNDLDAVAKTTDKLATKLSSRIANGLTDVYVDLAQMGLPVPTMEQVRYANSTGDYLGSMVGEQMPSAAPGIPVKPPLPTDCPEGQIPRYIVDKSTNPPTIIGTECVEVTYPPTQPPPQPPQQPPIIPGGPPPSGFPDYVPPPREGEYEFWCGPDRQEMIQVDKIAEIAREAGWVNAILPTKEYPVDTQVRHDHWNGEPISRGYVNPDFAGRCPIGLMNGGGTGVFYNICVPPPCDGTVPTVITPVTPIPPTCPSPTTTPTTETCPTAEVFSCAEIPSPMPPVPPSMPSDLCEDLAAKELFKSPVLTVLNEKYCGVIDGIVTRTLPGMPDQFATINMGMVPSSRDSFSERISLAIFGSRNPIIPSLVNRFKAWLNDIVLRGWRLVPCDPVKMAIISPVFGFWKFINQWFGVVPKAAMQTLQQAENMACQVNMPAQQSVDAAYLAAEIDKCVWECWTKLNGNVVQAAEKGIDTLRTRPNSAQLAQLYRRRQIKYEEMVLGLRQNGVMREEDMQRIFDLTQDWPSLSDLTPMLVRDVWDDTTIDWREVDRLFEDKYAGDAKKYFDAIGITKEVAKYYWRAHFHLPSFTMASEMYHRFRHLPPGHPLRTDLEKVKALLIQDDWHPDWIDRMLAITFRPMRLVDIRTAYDMRIIDDEGLKARLRILGYSDDDVDVTFRYWNKRRDIRDAKQGGFPSVRTLIKQYANCEIDDHTFRYQLSFIVESEEQELKAIEAAGIARHSEDNRRTIAGVSWQYKRGLISEDQATAELARQGIDPSCVPSLVRTWKSQAAKQPKQIAAASLCKMLEQGVISQSEFVNALLRVGYNPIDADRIMRSCAIGLTQKEMRRANQEAARLARERKASDREAAKLRRLEECGEPPCPANRQKPSRNGEASPTSPVQ